MGSDVGSVITPGSVSVAVVAEWVAVEMPVMGGVVIGGAGAVVGGAVVGGAVVGGAVVGGGVDVITFREVCTNEGRTG